MLAGTSKAARSPIAPAVSTPCAGAPSAVWLVLVACGSHHEAPCCCWVMGKPCLQGDHPLSTKVNGLTQSALIPVPNMQLTAILTAGNCKHGNSGRCAAAAEQNVSMPLMHEYKRFPNFYTLLQIPDAWHTCSCSRPVLVTANPSLLRQTGSDMCRCCQGHACTLPAHSCQHLLDTEGMSCCATVLWLRRTCWIKAFEELCWCAKLTADHDVVTGLVPGRQQTEQHRLLVASCNKA